MGYQLSARWSAAACRPKWSVQHQLRISICNISLGRLIVILFGCLINISTATAAEEEEEDSAGPRKHDQRP